MRGGRWVARVAQREGAPLCCSMPPPWLTLPLHPLCYKTSVRSVAEACLVLRQGHGNISLSPALSLQSLSSHFHFLSLRYLSPTLQWVAVSLLATQIEKKKKIPNKNLRWFRVSEETKEKTVRTSDASLFYAEEAEEPAGDDGTGGDRSPVSQSVRRSSATAAAAAAGQRRRWRGRRFD